MHAKCEKLILEGGSRAPLTSPLFKLALSAPVIVTHGVIILGINIKQRWNTEFEQVQWLATLRSSLLATLLFGTVKDTSLAEVQGLLSHKWTKPFKAWGMDPVIRYAGGTESKI